MYEAVRRHVPEDSTDNIKSHRVENLLLEEILSRMPQQTDRLPQDIYSDAESHNSINV